MAVTDWIDKIAQVFEVANGKGGTVLSYRMYDRNNIPEALTSYPCAISYVTEARHQYSLGGPCLDFYNGVTEFHLTPNASKANLPYIMPYFARIRDAAAGNITLSGTVAHFLLRLDEASVTGPVTLQYGQEEPHHGLVVRWEVKEEVSGDFTPAA